MFLTSNLLSMHQYTLYLPLRRLLPFILLPRGFMGISANSESWKDAGAWANTAHMPSLLQSPHYQIVALCNSSVEAARAAIRSHAFPESTKAYGSLDDLAADPDIDLVVSSVNVKKHYGLIKQTLLAGKDAIVEWSLGESLVGAEELTLIAQEKSCATGKVCPSGGQDKRSAHI